jgi:autotransporter-associated beta strand protein
MEMQLKLILLKQVGTLLLSANNTYTGQTNINAGIISITHNNALGSADGATIVADGASLSISNDITSAENITINGTGISSNGAIRNTADDNTLTGLITLAANSEIQIDSGSSLTLNPTTGNAVTGTYNLTIESVGTSTISDPIATSTGNITKTGAGTLTLSGTNSYTGDTTISAGTIKLTGAVNALTDLIIASGATLDLQATQTFATLDLDGTITRTANTSALTITGTSDLGGSITTSGTQDYEGAITLTGNTTLVSGDQITFDTTVNSETDETNNLTVTATELQVDGIIGGTQTLGAISITGILDLNAAITNATSLSVSSTSDLGARCNDHW